MITHTEYIPVFTTHSKLLSYRAVTRAESRIRRSVLKSGPASYDSSFPFIFFVSTSIKFSEWIDNDLCYSGEIIRILQDDAYTFYGI
jgi:hypothetical protein